MTCPNCNGTRLQLGGWMGPTPEAPYPRVCACAADLSPRGKQVVQAQWLMDNHVSHIPIFTADLTVLYVPHASDVVGIAADRLVSQADLVVGSNNVVLKNRYGAAGYALTDEELTRIRTNCARFTRL